MAYSNVVSVQITIQAVALSQAGFGTPIFMTAHGQSDDRVISVSSANELITGFGFPTDHPAVSAATQFFINNPSVNIVKIGRIAGSLELTVDTEDNTTETITANILSADGANLVSGTADGNVDGTDRTTMAAALASSLVANDTEGLFDVNYVGGSSLTITATDPETAFRITTSSTGTGSIVVGSFEIVETASAALTAIRNEDDDFYFVTTEARPFGTTLGFCQELSFAIESLDKMYFTSSNEQADLDYTEGSFFKTVGDNARTNTVVLFHQYANGLSGAESYPECYHAGYNAPYDAGSVTWSNLSVALPVTTRPNSTKPLTTTDKTKLQYDADSTGTRSAHANFVEADAGVIVLRTGQTASGEWIDVVRGVHWLTEDMTVALKSLLFNQKGGKVPFNDSGIARVREVCQSSLQRAVNRGFLDSYTLTVPLVANVPNNEWIARLLSGVEFTGILAGAIHTISVQGTVTTPTA